MREILFRGKCTDDGCWVFGYLVSASHIGDWVEANPVDPATVGQFTGLTDSKGTRIFEGDIIRIGSRVRFVFYGAGTFRHTRHGEYASDLTVKDANNCEVIGTIHDNPELLEVKEDA